MEREELSIPPEGAVISPKSSHAWLREHNISDRDVRRRVGADILQNARELNPNVPWGAILNGISWKDYEHGRLLKGAAALYEASARGISNAAKALEWDMHAPEVVYMSGSIVESLIGRRLGTLAEAIASIEEGRSQFSTENARETRLADLRRESGELGTYSHRIHEALETHATQHLPQAEDPNYLDALKNFPFTGHSSKATVRGRAFSEFQRGNYGAAVEALSEK